MDIIEHLDLIDWLVSEQKPPSEIRGHILAIREQIETYSEKSKNLSRLEAQNAALIEENTKFKTGPPTIKIQNASTFGGSIRPLR
jgi:hypothetical protein